MYCLGVTLGIGEQMTLWQKLWNDGRNLGEYFTDKTKVEVEWSRYLFDLRVGFKREGEWKWLYIGFWKPVRQNFWNGAFTLNVYVVKTHLWRLPFLLPRLGMVIRFSENHWFQFGVGWLFDRATFALKCIIADWVSQEKNNPGVNAKGWNEGPI